MLICLGTHEQRQILYHPKCIFHLRQCLVNSKHMPSQLLTVQKKKSLLTYHCGSLLQQPLMTCETTNILLDFDSVMYTYNNVRTA